jgi:hypothetical protein
LGQQSFTGNNLWQCYITGIIFLDIIKSYRVSY